MSRTSILREKGEAMGKLCACTVYLALAAVLIAGTAQVASANTVVLQQGLSGYSGTTDAWLDESQKRDNYGGSPEFQVRWDDGVCDTTVMRFELAGIIPPGQIITSAMLGIFYLEAGSMQSNNAMTIKPFRIVAGKSWYENTGNGLYGHGVSWRYRDDAELLPWTEPSGGLAGGWNDKADDGNGTNAIKREGGSVPNAIEPQNWVTFDVTNTVQKWYLGTENNGFLLAAVGFVGSGTTVYGRFISRNDSLAYRRPMLSISYVVPEPTSMIALGTGVLALSALMRKRSAS